MTPHDIYVQLTTGPGSAKLDAAQHALRVIWRDEAERAARARIQGNLIQNAWQGPASDAAYGAAEPLAKITMSGADLLEQAQDLTDRQSGSFNRAKNDVRPVGEAPPEPNLLDAMSHLNDYEKQVTDYQSDAQHNIAVFRGYDGASSYNETNMPTEYSTPSHSGGGISVVPDGTPRGDVIEVPDQQQPPPGGGDPGPGGGGEPRRFGTPPGPGGTPVGGPSVGGQQTSPSDFVTPGPGLGGQPAASGPGPAGPGQFGPGVPVGGFNPGSPRGSGPLGGSGPRGGAYGGGPGRGPGGGVPGGTGRGPGAGTFGPGARAGALAAEEAAAQRAAAAAAGRGAGSGAMGGAPVGAGRGKGDEDDEHKRKVLIEADAEGLFGSDELTAPQVIGDDEYED